jgi:surface antigen
MSLNVSLPQHTSTRRRRLAKSSTLLALTFALPGCSMAIPLPGFVSKEDVTGSIKRIASPLSPKLDGEDSRRAMAALGVALDPQGNGERVAWDNPQSGLKGTFTPVGAAYAREDRICRAFLGEIGSDGRIKGTGCRDKRGDWAVLDVKPLKRG